MSSLKKEALAACQVALARLGFVKYKGALILERDSQASGWIGLNLATRGLPRLLQVNPVVGVRFAHLEKIMLRLRDDVPKTPTAVFSKPLGYLMPENSFRFWDFSVDGDSERVAKSLSDAVHAYGVPYIVAHSDWVEFSRNVDIEGFLLEHEKAKIAPVVHVINGDLEGARGIVDIELERVSGSSDMYAQSYRRFADRFQVAFG
ncbi:hypothetical protein [Streptomyces sp. NPDC002952]|uniref:hypothetical protein n=1 Tax=Streptomyces sp. NPDC002952 TaxID=3364673 RepID=UPI0036C5647D